MALWKKSMARAARSSRSAAPSELPHAAPSHLIHKSSHSSASRRQKRDPKPSTNMVLRILWNVTAGAVEKLCCKSLTRPDRLLQPFSWRARAGFLDCDVNMHLSNSSFFYMMDLTRWRYAARHGFLNYAIQQRAIFVIASQCIRLRHPIAPFQKYEIRSQMNYYDDDWMYFVHHFYNPRNGKLLAEGLVRIAIAGQHGRMSPKKMMDPAVPLDQRPTQMPEMIKGLLAYDASASKSMQREQEEEFRSRELEEQHRQNHQHGFELGHKLA